MSIIFKDIQRRRIKSRKLHRKRKRQERRGSEKTKIKKYMFHLEKHNNKGNKVENNGIEVCTIYLCWGDILLRPK